MPGCYLQVYESQETGVCRMAYAEVGENGNPSYPTVSDGTCPPFLLNQALFWCLRISSSLRVRRRILPTWVLGRLSRNSMERGTLYPSLGAKTPQTRSKSGFAGVFNFFLIGGKLTLSHFPMARPYLRGTSHARRKSTQCPEASERRVSF